MTVGPVVVDTNVVVSGLVTGQSDAPTARILDGMLRRSFNFLLSIELLSEYRSVLLHPKLRRLHGLTANQIDLLLSQIARSAIFREPRRVDEQAPDSGDQHLWALLATHNESILVTGDRALLDHPPKSRSVMSPAAFVGLLQR